MSFYRNTVQQKLLDESIRGENIKFSKIPKWKELVGLEDPISKDLDVSDSENKRNLHASNSQQKKILRKKKAE